MYSALFGAAFADLGLDPELGAVAPSQRPELGQFQCNGALAAAKAAGRNPREIAQDIVDRVSADPRLGETSIAGPGFVNVSVTDEHLVATLAAAAADPGLGIHQPPFAQPTAVAECQMRFDHDWSGDL